MLSAIRFNRESLQAYEIEDVISKRMLPAEFEVFHLISAQAMPKTLLCLSHILAQTALQLRAKNFFACLAFHLAVFPIPTPALPLMREGENPSPPRPSP